MSTMKNTLLIAGALLFLSGIIMFVSGNMHSDQLTGAHSQSPIGEDAESGPQETEDQQYELPPIVGITGTTTGDPPN